MNGVGCLLFLLLACLAEALFCPRAARADDWLPVAPEDLALKDNPASPGVDAMVLYRNSFVSARDVNTGGVDKGPVSYELLLFIRVMEIDRIHKKSQN